VAKLRAAISSIMRWAYRAISSAGRYLDVRSSRINDKAPSIRSRSLNLSKGAAAVLGFVGSGHTSICTAEIGLPRVDPNPAGVHSHPDGASVRVTSHVGA